MKTPDKIPFSALESDPFKSKSFGAPAVVARAAVKEGSERRQAMRLATTEKLIETQGFHAAAYLKKARRHTDGAGALTHPADVIDNPAIDLSAKRQILAAWASDASAVQDQPELRWLLGTAEPVLFEDVRAALARLDRVEGGDDAGGH